MRTRPIDLILLGQRSKANPTHYAAPNINKIKIKRKLNETNEGTE